MEERDLAFYLGDKVMSDDGWIGVVTCIDTPSGDPKLAVYTIEDENDGIERIYFGSELHKRSGK